jgi:hypothetical protein
MEAKQMARPRTLDDDAALGRSRKGARKTRPLKGKALLKKPRKKASELATVDVVLRPVKGAASGTVYKWRVSSVHKRLAEAVNKVLLTTGSAKTLVIPVELSPARISRISKLAGQVFGDREKAKRWLSKPKRALGGKTPLSCLTDKSGEQAVENMLYQIDYGGIT